MTTFTIPKLQTERLTLRPYRREDFPTYAAFLATDRSKYMGGPYSEREAWGWFTTDTIAWQFHGFGTLAIEVAGQLAGYVGLIHPPSFPEPECGWTLYDGFTGQGFATEAGRAMLDHTFATTDLKTIVSYTHPANTASHRVAERLGGVYDPDAATCNNDPDRVYRHFPQGAAA